MVAQGKSQLCRVFSGPHTGAEVPLCDGTYVVGADDACDLVLSDPAISARHARLDVAGASVRCTALDGAEVYVAGRPVGAGGRKLAAGEYFTLGATHLAVGPADAPWPSVPLPDVTKAAEGNGEADPEADAEPAAAAPAEARPADAKAAAAPRKSGGSTWLMLLVLLLMNAALVAILLMAASLWHPAAAVDPLAQREALEQIVAQYESDGAVLRLSRDRERWLVRGYVAKAADVTNLKREVRIAAPRTIVEAWDTPSLANAVKRVLSARKIALDAEAGKPGEVIVSGRLDDRQQWPDVQKQILADVRALRRLEVRLKRGGSGADATETVVSVPGAAAEEGAAGAAEAGTAAAGGSQTQAPGGEPSTEVVMVDEAPPEDDETVVTPPPTVPEIMPEPPLNDGFPVDLLAGLQSVSIGTNSSLTFPEGRRLFPGALLPGGYRVKEIRGDALVLVKDGVEQEYSLGGVE